MRKQFPAFRRILSRIMQAELPKGHLVAERYRIEAVVGEGAMGTIYRARHVKIPRLFAVKVLKPELARDPTFAKRFLREAVAASQVVHPNVVSVTDYGELPDGSYYIAMEYLDGVTLQDELERLGTMPPERALDILIQLTDALADCHRRHVVHRDLKTENIVLCTLHGRPDTVKLVDFGIARLLGPEDHGLNVTAGGVIFGTPEYLSPERALDGDVDGRADIYAVGIIAYEMVVGRPPFVGRNTQVLRAHLNTPPDPPSEHAAQSIPRAFDSLVLRCLAKAPEDRYATAQDLLGDLLRVRGTLAGAAADAAERAGPHIIPAHPAPRVGTGAAWTTIGERPAARPRLDPAGVPQPEPVLGTFVDGALGAEVLLLQGRSALRDLAYALSQQPETEDPGWTERLSTLLPLEQEAARLAQEVRLLTEQKLGLWQESDRYLSALARLQDQPDIPERHPGLQERLKAAYEALSERLDERERRLRAERQERRAALREVESRIASEYAALAEQVAPYRATAKGRAASLFAWIDQLQARLAEALGNLHLDP